MGLGRSIWDAITAKPEVIKNPKRDKPEPKKEKSGKEAPTDTSITGQAIEKNRRDEAGE